ncbi:MAG: hypothetical protein IPP08_00715 [Chlorobiota bacterium]|nr:hypothetical protein [Chlorobiota bacterium]QQS66733.1 MAG: hypothetical protein IPP08_00715 [Chlorobiota bacterium]
MGVIFTFFSTNLLLVQDPIISPPPCIGNECTDLVWHYDSLIVQPQLFNYQVPQEICTIKMYFKHAVGCGKCYLSIIGYKIINCVGFNNFKQQILNGALENILVNSVMGDPNSCKPSKQTPCVNSIRVFTGACKQEYHYYDTPGHDPNGNTVAYVPIISPWGFLGPNVPIYIPILPGETVYVPCSPVCCKATYQFCAIFGIVANQEVVVYTLISTPDSGLTPNCSEAVSYTNDNRPCIADCWFSNFYKTISKPIHK